MKKKGFWGYTSNGRFSVGCTGQTVYLYDENDNEIGKFKDIIYAYTPMISPSGKLFIVKSTDGRLAVYSLESFSLIKKFRFSKVDGAQDDGFCFSPDGKLFINIERQKDSLHSAISVYDTSDFSLVNQTLFEDEIMLDYIEFDEDTNSYYVLGFKRNEKFDGIRGLIAKFEDGKLKNVATFPEKKYDTYNKYKTLEIRGFTEKAFKWSYASDKLKSMNLSLAKLYAEYNK